MSPSILKVYLNSIYRTLNLIDPTCLRELNLSAKNNEKGISCLLITPEYEDAMKWCKKKKRKYSLPNENQSWFLRWMLTKTIDGGGGEKTELKGVEI